MAEKEHNKRKEIQAFFQLLTTENDDMEVSLSDCILILFYSSF